GQLIQGSQLRYIDKQAVMLPADLRDHQQGRQGWDVSLSADAHSLVVVAQSDLFTITQRARLDPQSPVLDIRLKVQARPGLSREGAAVQTPLGLLGIELAEHFIDHFEDEQDLYDDGAHLSAGRILRPWR